MWVTSPKVRLLCNAAMNDLLSVIVVSWNVKALIARCLASVHAASCEWPVEIIVVDNGSIDGSIETVRHAFPQATVVANAINRGFSVAINQGIDRAKGGHLLLLNPDTEIVGNALSAMVSYLRSHPHVGVVGPRLLNTDGSTQSSRRRFPNLCSACVEGTILQRYFPRAKAVLNYYCADQCDDEVNEVDWLVGACLLVRRDVVEQVGLLDERFFMYSEEVDWCYRIRKAGWKVVYLPQARVIHHHGQSSRQDAAQSHIYFQDSKSEYFAKHRGAWVGEAVRAYLMATYLFELMAEGAKWLFGNRRALRGERLRLLFEVSRSGLRVRRPEVER